MAVRLAIVLALLVLAFLGSELVIPRAAEDRVREELARNGDVRKVRVKAFPAIKLLFGRADRVEIELTRMKAGSGRLAELLDRAERTGELSARVDLLEVGPLMVRDASLTMRDDLLRGEASLTREDITAAVPFGNVEVTPVVSPEGELVLETSAPVFGTRIAVRARVGARDGAIVAAADGLLGGLGTITVFNDPRVRVDAVGARPNGDGFVVTAEGRLG